MKSNLRNEIKSYIVRQGMTMQEIVDLLRDEHGWSDSVSNLSNKLQRESLRYVEAVQLADALGYEIVLRQLLYQIILQYRQLYRSHFRQHFFQNRALLNEPSRSGFALLDSVSGLRFLQSVLCLQQLLFCIYHVKNPPYLRFC